MRRAKAAARWQAFARWTAAVLAVVGVLASVLLVVLQRTPQPTVSASGSTALLDINRGLLNVGTGFLAALVAACVLGIGGHLGSAKLREMHRLTRPPREGKGLARYLLAPLLVATVAMGTSLGGEAGRGARQPVEELLAHTAVATESARVLLPYGDALPFNDAVIAADAIEGAPSGAVPIRLVLGSASNPSRPVNPSSAALVTIPDGLWAAMGLPDEASGAVATTAQFADTGDTVLVNGVKSSVVATLDWFPGLDRTAVLMRLSDTAFTTAYPTVSAILLVDDEAQRWGASNASALGLTDTSLGSWLDQYNHFWARSVSPLSMEYLLALLLVGAVASGFIRGSDILRRRRLLAVQHILGVTRRTLVSAELHRAAFDTATATLLGAPLYILLIAVTNSSQYGVSIPLDTSALGAGALLVGLSMLLSVTAATLMVNRMDTANEVR